MRSIESPEEVERKKRRNARFFGIFMLLILVGSTLGFAFFYNPIQEEDKNQQGTGDANSGFLKIGNTWNVNLGGQSFSFNNRPSDIKNISIESNVGIQDYSGKPLYIESSNQGIYSEIASTLGRYAERVQEACYGTCENPGLPEKTCSDNLIIWKESIQSKVYQNNSCIFIEGDMKAVDAFLFKTLGFDN